LNLLEFLLEQVCRGSQFQLSTSQSKHIYHVSKARFFRRKSNVVIALNDIRGSRGWNSRVKKNFFRLDLLGSASSGKSSENRVSEQAGANERSLRAIT
jgi:hypothetical protein